MQTKNKHAATITFLLFFCLVLPIALSLSTVLEPAKIEVSSANPTPLGYTISLSLFVFPMMVLLTWFLRRRDLRLQKQAFKHVMLLLVPTGIILDVLFGHTFFSFDNHHAVIGWMFPALGGGLPVEELVFYLSGFVVVLLFYIWCDEYWFAAYNIPDYVAEGEKVKRILTFHPVSLIVAVFLIVTAVIYKKMFSSSPSGMPWYLMYLVLIGLLPSSGLYPSVRSLINWRAFSFTSLVIVLISLIWEVSLALVYGWWGFRPEAMMGFYIEPWNHLPLEEVILWFAVSYTTIIIYEALKLWKASGKKFRMAFFGVK
ncbi:MAG: hypothetical protein OEY38_02730 [Gammaproteobacteria bacterium]|nr:hypothetical protein [Gammaproteobacteria bacterium]